MALFAGIAIFLAISALMYGVMAPRAVARAYVDRRLARARGLEVAGPAQENGPALRANRFSRAGGGFASRVASIQTAQRIGDLLERAGWKLSVTEFAGLTGIVTMVAFIAGHMFGPLFGLLGGALGLFLPYLFLRRAVSARRGKFNKQLVEALTMVANALRAGTGLLQALDQAANQLSAPISVELRRTLHDIQIGAVPDEAFEALNQRIRSDDLDISVTAIIVQRQTGGNLAEVLDNVAHTMRERMRIRGEIKTLTTQQQLSGYLLGAAPLVLFLIFNVINHKYMEPLMTTAMGHVMIGVAVVLEAIAFFIIRKIVNIDV
jgi:tight adherence protein B